MKTPGSTVSPLGAARALPRSPDLRLAAAARAVPWLLLAGALALAHDGLRALQMGVLALPVLLLVALPLQGTAARRARQVAATAWFALFLLDAAVRHHLGSHYGAAPDSTLVLGAIANTSAREAGEYLAMQALPLAGAGLAWLLAVAATAWALGVPVPGPALGRRTRLALLAGVLLLVLLAHASKPWRRWHPLLFWPHWQAQVQALRSGWLALDARRAADRALAQAAAPQTLHDEPATAVLVISDSINRDNLSTHGYPRATAPRLQALLAQDARQLVAFRHAWSPAADTLGALQRLFYFDGRPQDDADEPLHLLALARAAGWHVTWIGNHDDLAIEHQHARHADSVLLLNRRPGRSGDSPDRRIEAPLKAALQAPHRHKLIVVHLLGAHPHYRLRHDGGRPAFGDDDAVAAALAAQGRSAAIVALRNHYDTALRQHDALLADTLEWTRQARPEGGRAAWMFLSDHGQEVGHSSNRAGHSPGTPSGYRIPAFVWSSAALPQPPQALHERPLRADWLAWTLTGLAGIHWSGRQAAGRDVLAPDYRFEPPALPLRIESFGR